MSEFEPAVEYVLSNEGGLERDDSDPGGITNHGISLRFLRSMDPDQLRKAGIFSAPNADTVVNMPVSQAIRIYHDTWWLNYPVYRIHPQDFASYVFDMLVNMGINHTYHCVNRAIMAWSGSGSDSARMDSEILDMINKNAETIFPALRSERACHYRILAALDDKNNRFLKGWLARSYRR